MAFKFFQRILGNKEENRRDRGKFSGEETLEINDDYIKYGNSRYFCQFEDSESGVWKLAYGTCQNKADRFFVLKNGELHLTEELEKAGMLEGRGDITDDGITAVIDDLDSENLSGLFKILDASGEILLEKNFGSNVEACALSRDSKFGAVSTLNPDCSTYVFNLDNGEKVLEHENREGNVMKLEFQGDKGNFLYLCSSRDSDPEYAIDMNGEVVENA